MPEVVGYFGVVASMKALARRQMDRKLMQHTELRELIIERIKDGWTPEQIADCPISGKGTGSSVSGDDLSLCIFSRRYERGPMVVPARTPPKVSPPQRTQAEET